ncbi:MAG: ZIP family metal transporter [Planctomycetaceae bacterium]|nr:ZIP family metal transporter [Planctomycetaceae bacterium]
MKSRFAWVGIAFGLGLHSIMDGVALTVSCLRPPANEQEVAVWGFWGLAAFLAIFLHKPLDAISITSVMSASGWKPSTCTAVNVSFALMCPVGALLAWWGIVGTHSHIYLVSHLLAFSAGIFFCISLSDLLPEMQFHAHNQWVLTISLMAGLGLAWALMWLDPVHSF